MKLSLIIIAVYFVGFVHGYITDKNEVGDE
jgi:F0F1-type ATP synthase assembly protein I